MPFSRVGMRVVQLHGPNGLISTAFKLKSTGKPTSGVKLFNMGSPFSKWAVMAQNQTTNATSRFTLSLIGSLTSGNPDKVSSSKFTVLVSYTSANRDAIKFSTTLTPAQWIGLRSTIFTTGAGRALSVFICAVP